MSDKMREALREAAELLHSYQTTLGPTRASTSDDDDARLWDRIDACREVLAAQPEQSAEPVAWMIDKPDEPGLGYWFAETEPLAPGHRVRALYTTPFATAMRNARCAVTWETCEVNCECKVCGSKFPTAPSVPDGWRLYSADASIIGRCAVTLCRDEKGRELWHGMPDDLKEADDGPPLFVFGRGSNYESALAEACRAAMLAAAPEVKP